MTSVPGRLALGALLGATILLLAAPAVALGPGEAVPEIEVNDSFNCDGFSLKEHRGRLVLFELFSTG